MLYILTNHSGDEFLARNHYQDTLQSLNYQLSNFTAWLNGTETNFTMVRAQLLLVLERCRGSRSRTEKPLPLWSSHS
jgi:multimeric flavodoxin WrbA